MYYCSRLMLKQMFLLVMKKYLHLIERYQGSWKCNPVIIGKITVQNYNCTTEVSKYLYLVTILIKT